MFSVFSMILSTCRLTRAADRHSPGPPRGGPRRAWGRSLLLLLPVLLITAPGLRRDALFPTAAGQAAQPVGADRATPRTSVPYDLEADEALGGHTVERHVGKTDEELRTRLRREQQISAASTYTDLETARRVVGAAIAQSRGRIDEWSRRSGARPNLVVNYREPSGRPIGRSIRRGARVSASATQALVVLRWLQRERRWIVLTSYPESR